MSAGLNMVPTPGLILKLFFAKSLILNEQVDRPARAKPERKQGGSGNRKTDTYGVSGFLGV